MEGHRGGEEGVRRGTEGVWGHRGAQRGHGGVQRGHGGAQRGHGGGTEWRGCGGASLIPYHIPEKGCNSIPNSSGLAFILSFIPFWIYNLIALNSILYVILF